MASLFFPSSNSDFQNRSFASLPDSIHSLKTKIEELEKRLKAQRELSSQVQEQMCTDRFSTSLKIDQLTQELKKAQEKINALEELLQEQKERTELERESVQLLQQKIDQLEQQLQLRQKSCDVGSYALSTFILWIERAVSGFQPKSF